MRKYIKKTLAEKLEKIKIVKPATVQLPPEFNMEPFCIKCGSRKKRWVNYYPPYPEIWIKLFCGNCGALVAEADNSRLYYEVESYISERKLK